MLRELAKGCGIRTSNRNSHEEQAILLKSVVAPTRYHGLGAGREAPEVDLIIYSGTSIEVVSQDWSDWTSLSGVYILFENSYTFHNVSLNLPP